QAEDGIRDFHVTGVQTCALPISLKPPPVGEKPGRQAEEAPEEEEPREKDEARVPGQIPHGVTLSDRPTTSCLGRAGRLPEQALKILPIEEVLGGAEAADRFGLALLLQQGLELLGAQGDQSPLEALPAAGAGEPEGALGQPPDSQSTQVLPGQLPGAPAPIDAPAH